MRYFEVVLITSSNEIEEKSKLKLREYAYDGPVAAINNYMYKSIKNGIVFFAYREEIKDRVLSAFSYDEQKYSFQDVYQYIIDILNDNFGIKRVETDPCEVTMFEFYEFFLEAKRRDLIYTNTQRILDFANLFVSDYFNGVPSSFCFELEEKIVSESQKRTNLMYDEKFKNELMNIESHKNCSVFNGNMVHYIISCRSVEAASDMTESLVQSLFKSNRIESRRVEIVSNIEPDLYNKNNHLEDVIENNYGGTVVIDLTEKFGRDPVDYKMLCKYIEGLVKKYRKQCLFIFTYNMDKPGFSYMLLPELKKYIFPVSLREGSGNRKAAVKYIECLIKNSEHAEYANQANEFFSQFQGNEFTQTEVLQAYEKFEAWCLNKNFLKAYDYELSDDFMLDRDSSAESSYDKLQKMIGLDLVKKQIDNIIAANLVEKERKSRQGSSYQSSGMHMIFSGNPGTAKTTVAKLFAGIAKEKCILKSGAFVERIGTDFNSIMGEIVVRDAFTAAKGGVLFIDEAYSIQFESSITALLQELEQHKDDVVVVLAGYNERMQAFLERNEGLKSRIPYNIDFPDYDANELTDIFKLMLKEKGLSATDDAINEAHYIFEKVRHQENFGNGRYVRNLIGNAIQKQSARLLGQRGEAASIKNKELFLITQDDIRTLDDGAQEERVSGTAQKELDEMIGLGSVKEIINKAKANFKLKKLCLDRGMKKDNASLHMVFTGNPGTAKTTVARLFAEILKDEKVLSTGNFVEVGRADLVGTHVGATAPLVKKRFKEASGGILFIDEAYSLCDSYQNGFGDEAITTIVQEMENHRDNVIVVFAGYPEQMQEFLERNPGLSSRIAFHVNFEDYTTDELCDITKLMVARKQMTITDDAIKKLRKLYESVKGSEDFGNGRFVRKMLEEAEMNLAQRILDSDETEITDELITTITSEDIPALAEGKSNKRVTIGFSA